MIHLGKFVEHELAKHDWSGVSDAHGPATQTPFSLREMILAETAEQATESYWKLENYVVVQGAVYEAAVPVTSVILAALATTKMSRPAKTGSIELLFQVLNGQSLTLIASDDYPDTVARCRNLAREGKWLFYREVGEPGFAGAKEILEIIDDDPARVALIESKD